MRGLMMDRPLLISSLIQYAAEYHGDTEIVTRTVEGPIHRYTYADADARCEADGQCAAASWASASATASRRIGLEHLSPFRALLRHLRHRRGAAHAQSAAVSRSAALHRQSCRGPDHVPRPDLRADRGKDGGAMADGEALRRHDRPRAHAADAACRTLLCYEELVGGGEAGTHLAGLRREHRLVALLHVGHDRQSQGRRSTTHRSTVLHSYGGLLRQCDRHLDADDCVLPVVPMFHVNAWGVP